MVRGGVYASIWTDHDRKRTTIELLHVVPFLTWVFIKPVVRLQNVGRYKVTCKHQSVGSRILIGSWSRPGYGGLLQFTYHQNNSAFVGRWLGPDREGNIRSGDWTIKRIAGSSLRYWFLWPISNVCEKVGNAFEIIFSNPAISKNAAAFQVLLDEGQKFEVDGLLLRKDRGVFNPQYSTVTRRLAECVSPYLDKHSYVLDLGTGSGYHAILAAKVHGCRVVAVDCDHNAIRCARENARQNGVAELIEFLVCTEDDLLSWVRFDHKFDVVIANLPFSSLRNTWRMRNSPYFRSFRGTRQLLIQSILALPTVLKPKGAVFIAHGNSGYTDLLDSLLEVSPWSVEVMVEITGKFDVMRIRKLTLSDFMGSLDAELMQGGASRSVHDFQVRSS